MIKRIYLRKHKRDPHQNIFGWGYQVIIEPHDWRNSWPTEKELEKQIEPFIHTLNEFHNKYAPPIYCSYYIGYDDLKNQIFFSVVKQKETAEEIRNWFIHHFRPQTPQERIKILEEETELLQDKLRRRNKQIRDLRKSLTTKK